ncbi:HoxN/HupN/NixA family nickel/cobalt transporter [Paraburkholderia phenoliruptrix]|uniref:HoxN/HupN/NixA family nickel/cobalt transporter n=1 Tax=Paraburkholderia phenoliruptrix TaxID=252970 RepID=UPI003207C550
MMIRQLSDVLTGADPVVKRRLLGTYGLLVAFNLLSWAWAAIAFRQHPVLLGTALIAYGLGLRHAVDADHIAAIDNSTRKLMQDGQRPVAVGLFFSIGHSTIIVFASLGVALVSTALNSRFVAYKDLGATASTLVSTGFLFAIAILNLFVLRSIVQAWRRRSSGESEIPPPFGPLTRLLRPLFLLVSRSWHLFPLGFLFGLGFDTATEVSLLGMSATQAARGISPWSVLVFPALFSAGMSLIDTLDGHLMLGAYGWAYMKPERKLAYNFAVTSTSVAVALIVGTMEVLGLLQDRYALHGVVWNTASALGDHFGMLGYAIIGIFSACWVISMLLHRARRSASPKVAV